MSSRNASSDLRVYSPQNNIRNQGLQSQNFRESLPQNVYSQSQGVQQIIERIQSPQNLNTFQNQQLTQNLGQGYNQQLSQQRYSPQRQSQQGQSLQGQSQQRQSQQVGYQQASSIRASIPQAQSPQATQYEQFRNSTNAKGPKGKQEKKKSHKHMDEDYEPLKIPADWELARKHGLARSVGRPIHSDEQETCPCCGYEVNREELDVIASTNQLSFLGSGFPLFYNFIMYCILILVAYFGCTGAYDLVTNLQSDFCNGENENHKGQVCPDTWMHRSSLANKIKRPDQIHFSENLNIVVLIVVTIILFFFRRSQRLIDKQIDDDNITPADYTVIVKNIPRGLDVDYKDELSKIFTFNAVPVSESRIVVTKVVLVFNIEELIKKEEGLKEIVEEKQKELSINGMNLKSSKIEQIDKRIEKADKLIEQLKEEIQRDGSKFSGKAFISFQTEQMKNDVLENNQHTTGERWQAFTNHGKSKNLSQQDLSWFDQKLFLEQAPEPNDIDWEFVHVKTTQKLLSRIKSWGIIIAFMLLCFLIIYAISIKVDELNDWAEEHEETVHKSTLTKIAILSGSVSWVIVLFNKFIMGYAYHHIIDTERISSKTKFNIQFAFKLTIALFINTALISYIVDILFLGNIITKGGFVQNETQIFIVNALFPPFVWLIDPYGMLKRYQRNKELDKGKMSVVTQQEANYLMEKTEYYQAKRYADIMKTMWFTFLFGCCIPIGILFSILGLSFYYWFDKYNVMRRRSVKENLAKEVSIDQIEMLELTIILSGIGSMTMSYSFFHVIHWQDIVVFAVGFILAIIPMEELNDYIFAIDNVPEQRPYDEVYQHFVTDYDRENPVTRTQSIKAFREHLSQYD